MELKFVLACVATLVAIVGANTVVYRVGDVGDYPDQGGKWVAVEPPPRAYYRDSNQRLPLDSQVGTVQRTPSNVPVGPCNHHQHSYQVNPNGYNRYPSNYAIVQPYPVLYYIAPPITPGSNVQQPYGVSVTKSVSESQNQVVQALEKQSVQAPLTTTSAPTSPAPPTPRPPTLVPSFPSFPVSSWQNYLCSVFPYLPSCQATQVNQQVQPTAPTYQTYSPYPGYSQLAQNPVYYIVQPEFKPQAPAPGVPGTVGIIRIIGPNPVKPDVPVSPDVPVKASAPVPPPQEPQTEPEDTVVTVAETKVENLQDGKEPVVETTVAN